jgi:hypothetical protein
VPPGLPLSQRKRDAFFIVAFAFFSFSSFYSDACYTLYGMHGDAGCVQANRTYVELAGDGLFATQPGFMRTRTALSAFVYGPFYLLLIWAFARGANWIRLPALLYVGSMVLGVCEHLIWEFALGITPQRPVVFFVFTLPYLWVPLLLGARMWRAQPFGERAG